MSSEFEIPHRVSLASQAGAYIRAGVRSGRWREWLPSERALCEELQVSRFTLRAALKELAREGVTEPVPQKGTRILVSGIAKRNSSGVSVGIVTPDRLSNVRPHYALWISKLRDLLLRNEIPFHVYEGRRHFEGKVEERLEALQRQSPRDCWILHLATKPVQRWFHENRVPCVVAGTPARAIDLPFVDIDNRALCAHALGHFYGKGHRKVVYLHDDGRTGGGRICVNAIERGLERYSGGPLDVSAIDIGASLENCLSTVDRLMKWSVPPTGIFVGSSFKCVAVMSHLQSRGVRIPEDVSIICRENDHFLNYYRPNPSRYAADPALFAKRLYGATMKIVKREVITKRADFVLPDFVEGESVARIDELKTS